MMPFVRHGFFLYLVKECRSKDWMSDVSYVKHLEIRIKCLVFQIRISILVADVCDV